MPWAIAPHTRAKHEILRRYLQAWQAILAQHGFAQLAYVDGFAGPGRYSGGEDGSPLIALKTALALQRRTASSPRLTLLFVEKNAAHADELEAAVGSVARPDTISVRIAREQSFEDAMVEFIALYDSRLQPLPPTFVFIDPFGWTGAPLDVIKRVMAFRSCEVLVNFMYEDINRFLGHPDQTANFGSLFGTDEWRRALDLRGHERNRFLHDLYERQLRQEARVKYVRSFQMKNENDVTDYYLFHGTNNLLGLKKMKEVMWRVDATGEFTFSDATDPRQMVLLERRPDLDHLRRLILGHFAQSSATVGAVEEFVVTRTAFRETHYKAVLKELELSPTPLLTALRAPQDRRPGTFADANMTLRFG